MPWYLNRFYYLFVFVFNMYEFYAVYTTQLRRKSPLIPSSFNPS